VHGKYLVRLLDKTDNRVRHLVPHGTEVRLKLRHTAEMGDPLELAKKWVVVPDCFVTVQRDQGPTETIGFLAPKEAVESILTKTGYDLGADSQPRIKVEQVESNGVALAYALQWSDYFRDWTFLTAPEYRQPEAPLSADRLLGTCVEGIRVDTDSPGFRERNIYAIANATGRLAPRTNVARSGLEMSAEVSRLMRNIYAIYFRHVEDEVRDLQAERGFSPTWAAGEPAFILRSLLRSRKERSQGKEVELVDTHAFSEAAEDAKLVLVEDENDRKIISPKALLAEDHFWTVDCALFRSIEWLLREVPERVSVRALTKTLSQSIELPTGVLLSHWDLHDTLSNLIYAKREVGEIRIDERQRRTDLKWIVRLDNPRWICPRSDWPRASYNVTRMRNSYYYDRQAFERVENFRILRPEAEIEQKGVKDEMIISAFHNNFLLPSPLQAFFTKESLSLSVEANDLRWMLLSLTSQTAMWANGSAQANSVLEDLGKEQGVWDELVNYGGEAAAAEIIAFRIAARESSWKRFGAALWMRSTNE
jgi:hypothetical protein